MNEKEGEEGGKKGRWGLGKESDGNECRGLPLGSGFVPGFSGERGGEQLLRCDFQPSLVPHPEDNFGSPPAVLLVAVSEYFSDWGAVCLDWI